MGGIKKHILRDAHLAFLRSENGDLSRYKTSKQLKEEQEERDRKATERRLHKQQSNRTRQVNQAKKRKRVQVHKP